MHHLWLFTHNLAPADQKVCVGLNHTSHPVQVDLLGSSASGGDIGALTLLTGLCSINHNLSSVNW